MASVSNPPIPATAEQPIRDPANGPLLEYIQQSAKTIQRTELTVSLLTWLVIVLFGLFLLVAIDHWLWPINDLFRYATWLILVVGSLLWMVFRVLPLVGRSINPVYAAKRIEDTIPEMKDGLISWLQLASRESTPRGVLNTVGRYVAKHLQGQEVNSVIDQFTSMKLAAILVGLILIGAIYMAVSPKNPMATVSRLIMPWAKIAPSTRVQILDPTPGNTTVTEGSSVRIAIHVRGWRRGDVARIRFDTDDGQSVNQVVEMRPEIEGLSYYSDFGKSFGGVVQPLHYSIEAGDAKVGPFAIKIQAVPLVVLEQIEYIYPPYMRLAPRISQGDGRIEAPEGTRVAIRARSNQSMTKARIELDTKPEKDASFHVATADDATIEHPQISAELLLRLDELKSNPTVMKYRLRAENQLGEFNVDPVVYSIKVIPDLAPEVQLASNLKDSIELPVNQRLELEVRSIDPDFGLVRLKLSGTRGNQSILDEQLFHNEAGVNGQVTQVYALVPSALQLKPGTQVEFVAIAEDNRHAVGSDQPEPNVRQSRTLKVTITPPIENPRTSSKNDQFSEKADQKSNSDNAKQPDKPRPNQKNNDRSKKGDSQASKQNDPRDKSNPSGDSKPGQGGNSQSQSEKNEKGQQKGSPSSESQDGSSPEKSSDEGTGGESSNSSEKSSSNGRPGQEGESRHDGEAFEELRDMLREKGEPSNESTNDSKEAQPSSEVAENNPSKESNQGNPSNESSEGNPSNESAKGNPSSKSAKGNPSNESAKGNPSNKSAKGNPSSESAKGNPSSESEKGNPSSESAKGNPSNESAKGNPSSESAKGNPSNESAKGNPSSESAKGNPSNESAKGNPSNESAKGNPSNESAKGNPSNESAKGNPSNESAKGNPSSESAKGNPSSESAKGNPSNESAKGNPSNESAKGNPSNESAKGNPSSESAKGNPSNESAKGNPSSESAKGNPSNESTKGNPANESSKGNPSNDSAKGNPFNDATKENSTNDSSKSNADNESSKSDQSNDSSKGNAANDSMKGNPSNATAKGEPSKDASKTGDSTEGSKSGDSSNESGKGTLDSQDNSSEKGKLSSKSSGRSSRDATGNKSAKSSSGIDEPLNSDDKSLPLDSKTKVEETEYARQATDMVLKALERQRDQPDPELLKRMGWTKEQMQTFLDRWKKARDQAAADPNKKREYDESLRSLGLVPSTGRATGVEGRDDKLRGLNEQGSRVRPPESLRERFEAFRKSTQP